MSRHASPLTLTLILTLWDSAGNTYQRVSRPHPPDSNPTLTPTPTPHPNTNPHPNLNPNKGFHRCGWNCAARPGLDIFDTVAGAEAQPLAAATLAAASITTVFTPTTISPTIAASASAIYATITSTPFASPPS